MEFLYKSSSISLISDKKEIILSPDAVILNGLPITLPGEYEKSSILMYVFHKNDELLYHFRVEGHWIAYIPHESTQISTEGLTFLGGIDILIMSGSKATQGIIEKIEPGLYISYGEKSYEIATILGATAEPISKYRFKESDLSIEKTTCIVIG